MIMDFNNTFFIVLLLTFFCCMNNCQSDIVFQETDLLEALGTHNINRAPIFKPDVCAKNELLYPGDKADDWVCDCLPAYVYHPDYDQCFALYRKEPCQTGEYLVLAGRSKIPECKNNPCRRDNQVQYQGRCYDLGRQGPCRNRVTAEVVEVNETTLAIGCVAQRKKIITSTLTSRFDDPLELKSCIDGSKKNSDICKNQNIQYWMSNEICGPNKVLYKIPQADDRICDCTPGYIYHSQTDTCYQAHTRGPCEANEKFILQGNIGTCQSNNCPENQAEFNGECVEIGKKSSCANGEIIGVDALTYDITCIAEIESEAPGKFFEYIPNCTKGGKRDKNNKC